MKLHIQPQHAREESYKRAEIDFFLQPFIIPQNSGQIEQPRERFLIRFKARKSSKSTLRNANIVK